MKNFLLTMLLIITPVLSAKAEKIGEVSTEFKIVGANSKIIIEAFDDPKIDGITCHLSRAVQGGALAMVGLSEDTSDASISCRQVGTIKFKSEFEDGEFVFTQKTSLLFKTMQVVRFYDKKRNVLVYLVYSDKLIDGSPKNAISSVPILKDWK